MPGISVRDEAGGTWTPIEQSPFASFVRRRPTTPAKVESVSWKGVVGVLAVAAAALYYVATSPLSDHPEAAAAQPDPAAAAKDRKITAWVMAQGFVKNALKAPGSADFGSVFGDYQNPQQCVQDLGGGRYRVTGWVDAQNSFGAKIRNRFAITVSNDGRESWKAR